MPNKVIGKCYICGKEITEHDLNHKEEGQEYPLALCDNRWPGDHICCAVHPGVIADFKPKAVQ